MARIHPESRDQLFRMSKMICPICGAKPNGKFTTTVKKKQALEALRGRVENYMTIDHILPRCLGGSNSRFNFIAVCAECNEFKGNRHPNEWLEVMKNYLPDNFWAVVHTRVQIALEYEMNRNNI
jgi:5-methylcytosine-specific restriction endonuclease McrA